MTQTNLTVDNPYASPPPDYGVRSKSCSQTSKIVFTIFKFAGAAFLVLLALQLFNIVGFTYRKYVDNNPLQNPVRVVRNDSEELELADGRLITQFWDQQLLADKMKWSGNNEVEIVASKNDGSHVEVYTKELNFICGIGDPWYTIPLIPCTVRRYNRVKIGTGRCADSDEANVSSEAALSSATSASVP